MFEIHFSIKRNHLALKGSNLFFISPFLLQTIHQLQEIVPDYQEAIPQFRFYGKRGRSFHFERIDGLVVSVHPVIEVWTGGEAGGTYKADHFSLPDLRTLLNTFGEAAQMHISGGVGIVVSYLQVVACATALVCFLDDYPVADGLTGVPVGAA